MWLTDWLGILAEGVFLLGLQSAHRAELHNCPFLLESCS